MCLLIFERLNIFIEVSDDYIYQVTDPNDTLCALLGLIFLSPKLSLLSSVLASTSYSSPNHTMHPTQVTTLGIVALALSLFPLLGRAVLTDVFIKKEGTTQGGCDNINYDLDTMFNEASTIIDAAVDAFNDYNNDFTVRKLALSFFGIQMNDQLAAPKDQANADALVKIQGKDPNDVEA